MPSTTKQNERTYLFNKSILTVCFGDITTSNAEALVSSDDYYLSMGGGVSAAILRAGGNVIALDATKKVPASLGDVVVTTAGTLPAQYIFHAVTIGPADNPTHPEIIIRATTSKCLELMDAFKLKTIAFPAIGAGVAGFTYNDVAVHMADVISKNLLKRELPIEVTLYLLDRFEKMQPIDFVRFFEAFAARASIVAREQITEGKKDSSPVFSVDHPISIEDMRLQRINNVRQLLADLEQQRFKIESELVAAMKERIRDNVDEIRKKLKENEDLRLGYWAELETLTGVRNQSPKLTTPRTIFLSSTWIDMTGYRSKARDQISRRDLFFRGMEHFGADPSASLPATKIVEEVRKADAYMGIFGVRYGSIDPATGYSMTELEFREAESSNKPMLLYILDDDADVRAGDIEPDPTAKGKLNSLKMAIMSKHVIYKFKNVDDLGRQIFEDLGKLVQI